MCSEVHEVNLAGVICDREEVIKGGGFSSLQRQGLEDKPLPPFLLLLLLLGLSEGEWWRTAQDRFASVSLSSPGNQTYHSLDDSCLPECRFFSDPTAL